MIKIIADIAPMGAVRMTQRSKFVSTAAQRYLTYKRYLAYSAKEVVKQPVTGAVKVTMAFYYPVPVSWSEKKRTAALAGDLLPEVKPDIDNVIKGVFDALNGVAWADDKQVVQESSSKRYSDKPRLEIVVEAV